METALAVGAAILTGLYVWLVYYGSRQRWMRGGVSAWRLAALFSVPFLVLFAAASVVTNNMLWAIPTIFMFVSGFISFTEWDCASRYARNWEPE